MVGGDEAAGDDLRFVATDLARIGVELVNDFDPYLDLIIVCLNDVGVWLSETDEELPLPVCRRSLAMWRSAFIHALRTGTRPRFPNSVVRVS